MKKIGLIIFLTAGLLSAQIFKVEKVTGNVKVQIGAGENWVNIQKGETLNANTTIQTENKSSAMFLVNNQKFALNESSAISLTNIKKMSLDDLILALAMEDMIDAPHKKEEAKSKNTAVYGSEINGVKTPLIESNNFGIKKLNGAVQLAENGYKESAVVVVKETFRKYPETKNIASFRIYFANILTGLGLNDDAYEEYNSIKKLKLTDQQKAIVGSRLEELGKKLLNKN